MRIKFAVVTTFVVAGLLLAAGPASAKTGKGFLYHDGDVVRTVVVPAKLPHGGTDPFYAVMGDAHPDQLGIAGLAPGDPGYTGGDWAFNKVTFNVAPYLLTSEAAVLAAEVAGDVEVMRMPDLDFRCPVQP